MHYHHVTASTAGQEPGLRFALLMPAVAYYLMQTIIIRSQGVHSPLAKAIGRDIKGKVSTPLYLTGIVLAFVSTWAADAIYTLVALIWLIPDRRIEKTVGK